MFSACNENCFCRNNAHNTCLSFNNTILSVCTGRKIEKEKIKDFFSLRESTHDDNFAYTKFPRTTLLRDTCTQYTRLTCHRTKAASAALCTISFSKTRPPCWRKVKERYPLSITISSKLLQVIFWTCRRKYLPECVSLMWEVISQMACCLFQLSGLGGGGDKIKNV